MITQSPRESAGEVGCRQYMFLGSLAMLVMGPGVETESRSYWLKMRDYVTAASGITNVPVALIYRAWNGDKYGREFVIEAIFYDT